MMVLLYLDSPGFQPNINKRWSYSQLITGRIVQKYLCKGRSSGIFFVFLISVNGWSRGSKKMVETG